MSKRNDAHCRAMIEAFDRGITELGLRTYPLKFSSKDNYNLIFLGISALSLMRLYFENPDRWDFSVAFDAVVFAREAAQDAGGEFEGEHPVAEAVFKVVNPLVEIKAEHAFTQDESTDTVQSAVEDVITDVPPHLAAHKSSVLAGMLQDANRAFETNERLYGARLALQVNDAAKENITAVETLVKAVLHLTKVTNLPKPGRDHLALCAERVAGPELTRQIRARDGSGSA